MSNILVIEDNDTMRDGISLILKKEGHQVTEALEGKEGVETFRKGKFDLVITDYRMEGMDGIEVLKELKQIDKDVDVVLITAYGTIPIAVKAMKTGASDFITKPFSPDEFKIKIDKVLQFREAKTLGRKLVEENRYLREEIEVRYNFKEIVGRSPSMMEVLSKVGKIARTDSSVLIQGESGTGKELVARAIHFQSPRKDGPFIKVNCAALAEGVLESELFGHEKGSFTGALRQKKGKFELAESGSIFLDEIGDIPKSVQIRLLRVLQEKEIERVGGERTISLDVRIVAATNKDLKELVSEGKFREDIYYRLNIIPLELPPLRDRTEDIKELVCHFLNLKCSDMKIKKMGIEPEAMDILSHYDWPGNVRELENIVERAIVLSDGDTIKASDLPILLEIPLSNDFLRLPKEDMPLNDSLESLERQLIEKAMDKASGVKMKAAQMLGLKTSSLYYKLEKYGMV